MRRRVLVRPKAGILDPQGIAVERALHGAGVTRIHRTDLCTACNPQLFFSHRRDAGLTGRQGVVGVIG